MAERSFSLQEKQLLSKKRSRVAEENETEFLTEDNEDLDSPEELLLPGEHPISRDTNIRNWLNSNTDTRTEDEGDVRQCIAKDAGVFTKVKISSSCMCKLFVVLYLLGCLLVSTLYIAIYGPNELYLMPQASHKPLINPSPTPVPVLQFYDNPYTEWVSERWTYDSEPYSDWSTLPEYISSLHQIASGTINMKKGVWLLDSQGLFFMYDIGTEMSDDVSFVNISENLNLDVHEGTRICTKSLDTIYIVSPDNVTLLNCSPLANDYCDISSQWSTPELLSVSSAVVSGSNGNLWIGTGHGLYMLNTTPPTTQSFNDVQSYSSDNSDGIGYDSVNMTANSAQLITAVEGPILSLAWRAGLLGSKGWGLQGNAFLLSNHSAVHQDVSFSSGSDWYNGSKDMANDFGLLVIGTPSKLYFYDGHMFWFEWVSVWEQGIGGVVDGSPVSLTFVPTGELFIGNNMSLSRLNIDYTFDRIGGTEGLPYNHILSLHYSSYLPKTPSPMRPESVDVFAKTSNGTLWIGTDKGWSLFDIASSEFLGYFYGPRWHSGSSVLGISGVDRDSVAVVLTDDGLTVVRAEHWTLEKKALHYQEILKRHIRDPGLVADCPLSEFVPTTCSPVPTDNDGLWTSWLIAAEALRYKVTGNEDARLKAWHLYQGLKFLVNVTGVKGLPARSVHKLDTPSATEDFGESGWDEAPSAAPTNEIHQTSNVSFDSSWHNSTTFPGWIWKGDTSSDEIVGHIFANVIAFDLVAQTTYEKEEVAETLDSIIGYIMINNYTLIDVTNSATQWGVWTPSQINYNQSWADEHGLNSLEILAGLLSAYRISGKIEYFEAWQELFNGTYNQKPSHYGINIINQRITFPRDINYSNDELAFLSYFVYFQGLKLLENTQKQSFDQRMFAVPLLSLEKTWRSVKKEKSAAWHSIYGNITGDGTHKSLVEDIVWSLRNWPLELVQWRTENSHRLDIEFKRGDDRFFNSKSQSVKILSPRERTQLRWNRNPYLLDFPGSSNEMDPGPWLMSYWLAKWIKLL